MITINKETLNDFSNSSKLEWIDTNGLGGYASSTVLGLNTRRYHGVLVAALNPPVEREVIVSKLDETLILNNKVYELSTNQFPGKIHPIYPATKAGSNTTPNILDKGISSFLVVFLTSACL